jgi:hypothetical protein
VAHMSIHWNTHSRSPRLAEVRCGVFSIILAGNQIADYACSDGALKSTVTASRSPRSARIAVVLGRLRLSQYLASCARDLGAGIPDRGPYSWSWGGPAPARPGGCYRLAVVLTLTAAPSARSLAAARGVRPARRRRERHRTGLHGQAQCAADQDAVETAGAQAMVRTDTKPGWSLRPWAAVAAGCLGVQPQTFGCGSPEA